jgi:hypothetical protein
VLALVAKHCHSLDEEIRMNVRKTIPALLAVLFVALTAPILRADTLNVSMVNDTFTAAAGTSIIFQAAASNPSSTETFALLSDSINLNPSTLNAVFDDSAYVNTWPFTLGPGGSFGAADLFTMSLLAGITPGLYTGTFTFIGNSDGSGTFNNIGEVSFTVDVIPSTNVPEPGTLPMLLLGAALAGALSLRKLRSI